MAIDRDFTRFGFAYDISKNVITKGEIYDVDVINQSIENILSTINGERVFLFEYGSPLPLVLFENITETNGEQLLDKILDAVETWEDRVILLRDQASLDILTDSNALIITIPYIIKNSNITTTFQRKVKF